MESSKQVPSLSAPKVSSIGKICISCFTEIAGTEKIICCEKNHKMCEICYQKYAMEIVLPQIGEIFPPRCPECHCDYTYIQFEQLFAHLEEAKRADLERQVKMKHILPKTLKPDEKLVSCRSCSYSEIWKKDSGEMFISCKTPGCLKKTCIICSNLSTENHDRCAPLSKIKADLEEALYRASIRKCPKCGFAGQKDNACTHITCNKCGNVFCYVCVKSQTDLGGSLGTHNGDFQTVADHCPSRLEQFPGMPSDAAKAVEEFHRILLKKAFGEMLKKYDKKVDEAEEHFGICRKMGLILSELKVPSESLLVLKGVY